MANRGVRPLVQITNAGPNVVPTVPHTGREARRVEIVIEDSGGTYQLLTEEGDR